MKAYGIFCVIVLILCVPPVSAYAAAGDGTAVISPLDDVVAGSLGTWTIDYTAADTFISGQLEVTIPDGWSPPQNSSGATPGFVTITSIGGTLGTPLFAGQVITIPITALDTLETVRIVYGAGVPAGRARAQTGVEAGVEFTVRDRPTVPESLTEILSSPILDVIADVISQLVFLTSPHTFEAGGESGMMRIQLQDQYGNRQVTASNQDVDLISTSGSGLFSQLSGGATTTTVTITSGTDTVSFYYRDTAAGTFTVTASADGQTWSDNQPVTVNPGPAMLFVSPEDTTATAGDFVRFRLSVRDGYGNPNPVPAGRTIGLTSSSTASAFHDKDDHGIEISDILIAAGDTVAVFDYRDEDMNLATGHFLSFINSDGLTPPLIASTHIMIDHAPVDTIQSWVVTENNNVPADSVSELVVWVNVIDEFINYVEGVSVTLSVSGSNNAINPPGPIITDVNGQVRFTVISTTAELKNISAYADGQYIENDVNRSFIAGPIDLERCAVDSDPATETADGTSESIITVTAMDKYDNPVSGGWVSFQVDPPAGVSLPPPDTATSVDGTTESGMTSTSSGTKRVTAYLNGQMITDTEDVLFTAGPVSAALSALEVSKYTVTANDTDFVTVTVSLVDALGNPAQGHPVRLDATDTNGGNTVSAAGLSGIDGVYQGTIRSTYAEMKTVQAYIDNSFHIDDSEDVDFVPGPPSPGISEIAVDPALVTADGSDSSVVSVTVKDSFGNPIIGSFVTIEATNTNNGNTITPSFDISDSNGETAFLLRSTFAETKTVSAEIDGDDLAATETVQFTAGEPDRFIITHDGDATAGVPDTVRIEALDGNDNRITSFAGTVLLSTDTTEPSEHITWGVGTGVGTINPIGGNRATYGFAAGDNGLVKLLITDTRAESIYITADYLTVSSTSASPLAVGHGPADRIFAETGDGQTAPVASETSLPLVVRVEDEWGNRVSGATVDFSIVRGVNAYFDTDGGTPGQQTDAVTDGSGLAQCDIWRLGETAETDSDELGADIPMGSTPTASFTATATPGDAATIVLDPDSPPTWPTTINQFRTVTATLRDAYANLVSGEKVRIFISDAPDGFLSADLGNPNPTDSLGTTIREGTTDATGTISVRYNAPATAGLADVVDASHDLVPSGSVQDAEFLSVASGATSLRVTDLSTGTVEAGVTFSFNIEAVDNEGNIETDNTSLIDLDPPPGGGFTFSLTDFGAPITQAALVNGSRTIYGRADNTGDWQVDIRDDAAGLSPTSFDISVVANSLIDHYDVTALGSVNAGDDIGLTVTARDAFDNMVASASRTLTLTAVQAADSSLAASDVLSFDTAPLESGTYSSSGLFYRTAESIRVEVSDGAVIGYSAEIAVDHAGAYRVVKTGGDATGIAAGDSVTLEARVDDVFGNTVGGENVTFTHQDGGGGPSGVAIVTDGSGEVSLRYGTGTTAGYNSVRAVILEGDDEGLETQIFEITTVPRPEIDHVELDLDGYAFTAGETFNGRVAAYDIYDNLITTDNSSNLIPDDSNGSMSFVPPILTLTAGRDTFGASDTGIGINRIAILSASLDTLALSPPITIDHGPAYEITPISGDTSGVLVGNTVTLRVRVRDEFGNPVAGENCYFAVQSDPGGNSSLLDGSGTPVARIVQTDGSGSAACRLETDTEPGNNVVNVSILDGPPPAREGLQFTVGTFTGTIVRYDVIPDGLLKTAGEYFSVEVIGYDNNENIAIDDNTTRVDLSSSGSATFDSSTVTLSGGKATVAVQDIVAELLVINAQTEGGGAVGTSGIVTIDPDVPSGAISFQSLADDTITADGISRSLVETGEITDQYGNRVATGTYITVSTLLGEVGSEDQDGNGGNGVQRATNTSGEVQAYIKSGMVTGTAVVDLASVEGSAAGSISIYFEPPPAIVYGGYSAPPYGAPGEALSLVCTVTNNSVTGLYLDTTSEIFFEDGAGHEFRAALESDVFIDGLATDTLRFASAVLDPLFFGGTYTPVVMAGGMDIYDSEYNVTFNAGSNSIAVSHVEITGITAPTVVSRGDIVPVTVSVRNAGGNDIYVQDIALAIDFGSYTLPAVWSPAFPDTLVPAQTRGYVGNVTIRPGSALGEATIDATVIARANGHIISDPSAGGNTATWTIQSAADIADVPGTLAPSTVTSGRAYALTIDLFNNGQAAVILDSPATRLTFTDGTQVYSAPMVPGGALTGAAVSTLTFTASDLPGSFAPGSYPVTLELSGSENGGAFDDVLVLTDEVVVQGPAQLTFRSGTVRPADVNRRSSISFEVGVSSSGGAAVECDPDSTWIAFDDGTTTYRALLDGDRVERIEQGDTTLFFRSVEIPDLIATGAYFADVQIIGMENGHRYEEVLSLTDAIQVQEPSELTINRIALSISPRDRITADQPLSFTATVEVQNNGQAPVRLDDIQLDLFLGTTDVTNEYSITPSFVPGADILNEGELRDIEVTLSDNIANAMSTGTVIIEAGVSGWDMIGEQTVVAQSGLGVSRNFLVQTPADPVIVEIIPSVDRATVEQTLDWYVDVVVRNDGESEIGLAPMPPNTFIDFSTSGDFVIDNPDSLGGGGYILDGGVTDVVRFTIDRTGTVSGPSNIIAQVGGVEINSGVPVSAAGSSTDAVSIEEQGVLDITSVTPSQDPVTVGQGREWTVAVIVENSGEADLTLRLDDADSTYARIPGGTGFTIAPPTELEEGGTYLPGGSSGTLVFTVVTTGSVALPGSQTIQTAVLGDDVNSGDPVWSGVSAGNVVFETRPVIEYAGGLSPVVVSRGTDISIQLDVSSTDPSNSELLLDYGKTEALFGDADGDTFRVSLFEGSVGTIPGGSTRTLQFSSGAVGTGIDIGAYPVSVHLEGVENGNPFDLDIDSAGDVIEVQEAPDLSITSIEVPSTVTLDQERDYDIRMNLINGGEAKVVIDFDILKTRISFVDLDETNRTAEYSIIYPTALEGAGTDTLAGGASDALVFTITRTGFTAGTMLVHGDVIATDVNNGSELSDDTRSGGWGLIDIQIPGAPVIPQLSASRTSVTSNQTTDWYVTVSARNDGEALLTLDMSNTWIFSVAPHTLEFTPPEHFTDGDSTLAAGESRDLLFTVTRTPDIPAGFDLPLEGHIEMVENNSLDRKSFDTEAAGSGAGEIRVQAPAALRISAVDNTAFNSPFVNTDQDFPVAFSVENTGEARADSIHVSLGSVSSVVTNTPIVIDELEGGAPPAIDTFFVTAANAPGSDLVTAAVEYAVDGNSAQNDLVQTVPSIDDTAHAVIQDPAALTVTAVTPSQMEVNAGQSREWTVRVDLENSGDAPAALEMPGDDDIEFFLSGQQQLDYRVVAPDTFVSGLPVTGIPGGGGEALIYTITRTGSAVGTIDIAAGTAWNDVNDPARMTPDAAGNSSVLVTPPSGLLITAVSSDAPNRDDQTRTSVVNTGQLFDLTVTVSNTGGDNIDSVRVAVTSTGNSTPTLTGSEYRSIPAAGSESFIFSIEAAPDAGFEVLTSVITHAVSENTGEDVIPAPPLVSIENVVVQQPAALSVAAQITHPEGAVDGTVSAGQTFDIVALVTNASPDAQVSSDGQLTLTLWGDFGVVVPDSLTRVFRPGTSLVWTITAPLTIGLDSLSVSITQTPIDINTSAGAAVTQAEQRMNIETEAAASLANCAIVIIAPSGATDNTLSTEQEFIVEASVTPSANSGDVWLKLDTPGFTIAGTDSILLTGIDGTRKDHRWTVTAPVFESEGAMLSARARGIDSNSGAGITSNRADIAVDVELRAVLDLVSAGITAPPEATDGVISVSVPFAVTARVENTGEADVDTAGARLELELPQNHGYTFMSGGPRQAFVTGEDVTWQLRSPDVPTGLGEIRVFIDVEARDVNTDTFAVVATDERSIQVLTQSGSVAMTNESIEGEIPPYVAPQAARNVPVIRAVFRNDALSPVGLDTIRVTVKDANGNTVTNPSSRVSAVRLLAGGEIYEADARGFSGPVVIDVDHDFMLAAGSGSGDTATVLIEVDIAGNAPSGEIRIDIDGSSDVVFTATEGDPDSRVPVAREDGGDIGGYFLSGPLSVMSSDFEEYVHNYPNPFRAGSEPTKISYFLTQNSSVKIQIWDLTGSLVWTKDIGAGEPGGSGEPGGTWHEVEWDGRNSNGEVVRNGVYICKLQAGSETATFKIAVAK